jgi:hypothetical protein
MATSAYNKYQDFTEQLIRGVHDFDAHTFKVALTNTAPTNTHTSLSQITEISAGNGYTAGGNATTLSISETGGTTTLQGTEVVFTASGTMATFRYAVLYNDTATSPADALMAYFDYGAAISLTAGETFTVRFNNASPGTIFTLA